VSSPRREYLAALLLGAAGAAVVLVAARQGWARVITIEPRPLPAVSVAVRGQDVLPAVGALGLAALAGLAAVLATRRLARRVVGGLLVVFGGAIIAVAAPPLTIARLRAAATHPATSVTGGSTVSGGAGGPTGSSGVSGLGLTSHVLLAAFPWRWAVLLGAAGVIAAGLLVAWRGATWPVMSSRYERQPARPAAGAARAAGPAAGPAARRAPDPAADPAALWESLSQGVDPTADPGPPGPPGKQGAGVRRNGD
jgi:uncharacterized membrane protein (TIGR02234 family)